MSEVLKIQRSNRSEVLLTQRSLNEFPYYDLLDKGEKGQWRPDPPVILSRMPEGYEGRYRFHLYNGTHRFVVAGERGLDLNGLIVDTVEDIPSSETLHRQDIEGTRYVMNPNQRLEAGLRSFLALNRYDSSPIMRGPLLPMDATYDLEALLKELQKQEQERIVPYHLPTLF